MVRVTSFQIKPLSLDGAYSVHTLQAADHSEPNVRNPSEGTSGWPPPRRQQV